MITDYSEVVKNGTVVSKTKRHKVFDRCDCSRSDEHSKNIELTVEYDDKLYYFLHRTPVVIDIDGSRFRLDTGGWETMTTKRRINEILPTGYKVKSVGGIWEVNKPDSEPLKFEDGMVLEI